MATVNKGKCEFCGDKFTAKKSGAKYCSANCRHNAWYKNKKKVSNDED